LDFVSVNRVGYLFAIFAFCIVSLAMFLLWQRESVVLNYGAADSEEIYSAIYDGEAKVSYSAYGEQRILDACLRGMTGLIARASAPEYNQEFAQRCKSIADAVLRQDATSSFALAVRANANAVNGDFDAMNQDLVASWQTGKSEQWIAATRNMTSQAYLGKLSEDARKANDQDLAILVVSYSGIQSIARLYRDNPDFRERITNIVSTLPDLDQRRFVSSVRRAVAEL
jgi:hypothetical protein